MEFGRVITKLGLRNSSELLLAEWDISQQSMPPKHIEFLLSEFIDDAGKAVFLPADIRQAATATGRRIACDSALRALAWHYHHCLFHCTDYPQDRINQWPTLKEVLGEEAGMFYLVVLLSGTPKMQAINKSHSVPLEIVRHTLTQLKERIDEYRQKYGTWGLSPRGTRTWRNHLCGQFYRLGRLSFEFSDPNYYFRRQLRAFRHRKSGEVIALSEAGVRYLVDGRLDGPGRIYDTTEAWVSRLTFTKDRIIGHPILPTGKVLRQQICLAMTDWEQVLAPGDPVLAVHIPGGSALEHKLCGQSFRKALEFFPKHFPEKPFTAFVCCSWLFDTMMEQLLGPSSNIVQFMQETYLFPVVLGDFNLLKNVFGSVPPDLTKAPRDSSLKRNILDYVLAGGHLLAGGGGFFLLADNFSWGQQVYRKQMFNVSTLYWP